jgi:hypothetical protein
MSPIFAKPDGYKNVNTSQMISISHQNNLIYDIQQIKNNIQAEKSSYLKIINDNLVCSVS